MARKKQSVEKRKAEVEWFHKKYLYDDENFELFIVSLCPYDLTRIVASCIRKGFEFNWRE